MENFGVLNTIHVGDNKDIMPNLPKVDLIFTSPPYNIGKKAEKSKLGKRAAGEQDSVSWAGIKGYEDSMPEAAYQAQQREFLDLCAKQIKDTGSIVYNHKERQKNMEVIRPTSWFPESVTHRQTIIWDRKTTHNHAPVYVYPTIEMLYWLTGRDHRKVYFKNEGHAQVWTINKETSANKHAAPFPLEIARRAVRMWCPEGGVVLDPHMGSGTTAVACILEGRQYIGIEKVQEYAAMARERISNTLPRDS